MRARDPLDALLGEHAVECAAGAAIAIEAQDLVIGGAIGADFCPHGLGNPLGTVVQARRQAGEVDPVEFQSQDFAGERAAADDEHFSRALPAAG